MTLPGALAYPVRGGPEKKAAINPGPACDPMIGPMKLVYDPLNPFCWMSVSRKACTSSGLQSECTMYTNWLTGSTAISRTSS